MAQLSALAATVGLSHRAKVQAPQQTTPARPAAVALAPVLSVYPNPSRGLVTVSLEQKSVESYKLRFSNIIGREVRMIALRPDMDAQGVQVNLSDLPSGVYFYSLLVNDKVISTKRLLLQN